MVLFLPVCTKNVLNGDRKAEDLLNHRSLSYINAIETSTFFQYRKYSQCICLKSLLRKSGKVFVYYFPPLPIIKGNIVISHHRLGETERRPGAGALPGRHLPLRHHLPGLPHAHAPRQAGRGLRLREAAAPSHLAQPGLHGPAAAVRDGRAVQGMRLRLRGDGREELLIISATLPNVVSEL